MLSPKLVQDIVAEQFDLTRGQLLGPRRLPHIVLARHIAMLLCLEMLPGASLPQVGRWFHRDHTSVLHARETMRRRIAVDPEFAKRVEDLRQLIIKAAHRRPITRAA
jgi:chromosomal replication initiator protein